MQFREWFLINEIFDNPLPIQWTYTKNGDWRGKFTINNKTYYLTMINGGEMPWEVKFELRDPETKKLRQDITGTGDAAKVFATVISGVKEWIEKENPSAFTMSVRDSNQQNLYRRILKTLSSNWEIEDYGTTFFIQNKSKPIFAGHFDYDDYY